MQREMIWQEIFKGEGIPAKLDKQGWVTISAKTIREKYGKYGKEPRILAKIDAYDALPEVFRKNDAAIMSLNNQEYAILRLGKKGKPLFPTLPSTLGKPKYIDVASYAQEIVTLSWENHFTSESQAMDAALAARILQDFVADDGLVLTIRGRRRFQRKLPLKFSVGGKTITFPLQAKGFQIEVDGGYESAQHVYLIEAKNKAHKTFNLRQVMFPYIFWQHYLRSRGTTKTVRPIFMIYTAHNYFFYEFTIEHTDVLNSLKVKRQGWYVLGTPPLTLKDVADLVRTSTPIAVTSTPFPQADSLLRLYDILEEAARHDALTAADIADHQEFTLRQGNYYASAAQWLGWLEKRGNVWIISKDGKRLLAASLDKRPALILQRLAQRPVFYEALRQWAETAALPQKPQIERWIDQAIKAGEIKPLSQSTIPRRASTVTSWLQILAAWVQTP